jgi:iron complex outermembrane receptor protein
MERWHGPGFDVKYIGGFWHYVNNNQIDGDATGDHDFRTPGLFGGTLIARNDVTYDTNDFQTSWSHEVDFTSNNDGPLQWLAAAYYYNGTTTRPSRCRTTTSRTSTT